MRKEQISELVASDCHNCSKDVKLGMARVTQDPKETSKMRESASAMASNAPNLY